MVRLVPEMEKKLRLHFLKIPSEKNIRSFDEKISPLFYNILINEKEIE